MQWVTNVWPAWPTTISGYITEQERLISMQMPYWGCPGWVHTDNSGTHQLVSSAAGCACKAALKGPTSPIEAYSCDLHILDSVQDSQQVTCMTMEDWHQAQQVHIQPWVWSLLDCGMETWGNDSPNRQILLNSTSSCMNEITSYYEKGVLYRRARPRESEETLFQLVLPAAHREVTLRGCHDEVGHLGLECMLDLMCDQFYWPCMAAQGEGTHWQVSPMPYLQGQAAQGPTRNIVATHPLELVHLDYLCLEPRKGLEENVLVVTDHFTQCTQAYVTWSQTTQTTAKTLWDKFIVHYGLPEKILSDQGRNFESQLVADLCKLMGTQKLWTSPYHPQTNGQCERFNSILIGMLGTLPPEKKSDWKNHIGALVHAYNCTWNSATGFSPYYLMYRRQPLPPCGCHFGIGTTLSHGTYHFKVCTENVRMCQMGP